MKRKKQTRTVLMRMTRWGLVGDEKAKESVAPVVSTAQFVVVSSRLRHVLARETLPRHECTIAVLNSPGESLRCGRGGATAAACSGEIVWWMGAVSGASAGGAGRCGGCA